MKGGSFVSFHPIWVTKQRGPPHNNQKSSTKSTIYIDSLRVKMGLENLGFDWEMASGARAISQ